MSKSSKITIALIIVAALLGIFAFSKYNSLVNMEEEVSASWSQVENQYQRRLDLIPNLVSTVKGFAAHETELYKEIAEARSKAGGMVNINESILNDSEKMAEFQKVQDQIGSSLQRLMVVSEAYPALKSDKNFLALQDQLEGTENRISVERKRFNDAVKVYNVSIKRFPGNIFAGIFGFEKKNYFASSPKASEAPEVKF